MEKQQHNACLARHEIEARLRESGVNATAQRTAICQYVLCEADHPTVEDVKKWADANFPKMSLATVYNTLHTLVEAKLLRDFKFPHIDKVIYDNNVTKHHHFLDVESGEIYDLSEDDLKLKVQLPDDVIIDDIDILIRGKRG